MPDADEVHRRSSPVNALPVWLTGVLLVVVLPALVVARARSACGGSGPRCARATTTRSRASSSRWSG